MVGVEFTKVQGFKNTVNSKNQPELQPETGSQFSHLKTSVYILYSAPHSLKNKPLLVSGLPSRALCTSS